MHLGFTVLVDHSHVDDAGAPIAAEAIATATTLARWGVTLASCDDGLQLSGLAGVVHGVLHQGHLLAAIVCHRGDLLRLARMIEDVPGAST